MVMSPMELVLSNQPTRSKARVFYGWYVVAAAFAVTFVGFGCAYTFSAFINSLQRDFGASRGSVSLVFSSPGSSTSAWVRSLVPSPTGGAHGGSPFSV